MQDSQRCAVQIRDIIGMEFESWIIAEAKFPEEGVVL